MTRSLIVSSFSADHYFDFDFVAVFELKSVGNYFNKQWRQLRQHPRHNDGKVTNLLCVGRAF